jgi:2-keto-3-deoxy-L-rhamnonate aldolase RhmA
MRTTRIVLTGVVFALVGLVAVAAANAQSRLYNTAKQKLMEGQQIVGGTVDTPDPQIYCAMANAGFDFIWIEMQHSPLSYQDVARMIWACKDAPAIPFIRVPDATEGDIQKAVDIGALGVIVPMVITPEEMQDAVKYAKYPPEGIRSQGGGQYRALWGNDYRATANDNIMIIAMIEQPDGVARAAEIAGVPGVDVVFVASSDLGSFSGKRQGDPEYEALVTTIHDDTLAAGKMLGGPSAWRNRDGFLFFQGPGTTSLIRSGARASLEAASGVAPIEGTAPRR